MKLELNYHEIHIHLLFKYVVFIIIIISVIICIVVVFIETVESVPSSRMPTLRHFWKRQKGHLFLWVLSILHSWFSAHVYLLLFCTVLLKKPWKKNNSIVEKRPLMILTQDANVQKIKRCA